VRGQVETILREAEAYAEEKSRRAMGEAQRFLQVLAEYQKAKDITRKRLWLETLEEVFPGMEKIIIEDGTRANVLPILPMGKGQTPPDRDGIGQQR
jgi:membrane protease subunit HflK